MSVSANERKPFMSKLKTAALWKQSYLPNIALNSSESGQVWSSSTILALLLPSAIFCCPVLSMLTEFVAITITTIIVITIITGLSILLIIALS